MELSGLGAESQKKNDEIKGQLNVIQKGNG